jgi:hypothetical protein
VIFQPVMATAGANAAAAEQALHRTSEGRFTDHAYRNVAGDYLPVDRYSRKHQLEP